MILVDANLLIYADKADLQEHKQEDQIREVVVILSFLTKNGRIPQALLGDGYYQILLKALRKCFGCEWNRICPDEFRRFLFSLNGGVM